MMSGMASTGMSMTGRTDRASVSALVDVCGPCRRTAGEAPKPDAPQISSMVLARTSVREKAVAGSATGWQEAGSFPTRVMMLPSNPRVLRGSLG